MLRRSGRWSSPRSDGRSGCRKALKRGNYWKVLEVNFYGLLFIFSFGFKGLHWDVSRLEFLAIQSLKVILQDWMLEYEGIIIEGDNGNVTNFLHNLNKDPSKVLVTNGIEDVEFLKEFKHVRQRTQTAFASPEAGREPYLLSLPLEDDNAIIHYDWFKMVHHIPSSTKRSELKTRTSCQMATDNSTTTMGKGIQLYATPFMSEIQLLHRTGLVKGIRLLCRTISERDLSALLHRIENPNSFRFLLKQAENLNSFRFLLKRAENPDLLANDPPTENTDKIRDDERRR
ncbi:hypothetical protein IEQ34_002891 [Dendrobium chrysotoxum]|uniref:Uncharacterized protein n=1 Tax=Dendrobium chrysotoxum TaxID=161865 RepID=A0AAV7HJV1_DENCH|nr:hypothetical protein IEQ34_002891 [Dendrobium chrysotoxum]